MTVHLREKKFSIVEKHRLVNVTKTSACCIFTHRENSTGELFLKIVEESIQSYTPEREFSIFFAPLFLFFLTEDIVR